MPVERGAILGEKWQIEGELGQGGMGAVLAATHVRNGLRVAIKLLHRDLAGDPELRERLRREAEVANRVGHPGIVMVLDDGVTDDGVPFLVLERLDGESLDLTAERRGGTLPPDEVLDLGERWLEIMAQAHAKGVVHRDLKPENVFVCHDGALKVIDFGIAHSLGEGVGARLTAAGVAMGTPAFMPPEQALGHWQEVDARSDVFALGASLFTLLTGRLLHEARTSAELLVRACTQAAPPVRVRAPSLPSGLASVLDRALAFRAADRFRDAGEMLAAWRCARGRPHGTTPGSRARALWLAASALFVCVLALGAAALPRIDVGPNSEPGMPPSTAPSATEHAEEAPPAPVTSTPIVRAAAEPSSSASARARAARQPPGRAVSASAVRLAPRDPLGWQ